MADKETAISGTEKMGDGSDSAIATKKPTFMQRYKAHMRKWWWAHLLVLIAIVLLVTLPLIYVGFPRIAQQGVDASTIEVLSLTAIDPTPTSFHLIQNSLSHSYNMYHPYLDPFNGSLSLAGSAPYGMVTLPGTQSGTSVPALVDQVVQITNIEAFTEYNTALMNSESIQVRINGSTWLHEMSLPATDVSYDKLASFVGFNKLSGFNITEFHVSLSPGPDGSNINGTVFIPNPTVITVALGNATFNTYVNDTLIGNATLQDLTLKRGNNTHPMIGYTNQTLVLDLLESTYKDGMLPVRIVGNSSIYNGQHLTYYEKALQQNVQSVTLNVGAALAEIGINITSTGGGGGLR